MNILTGQGLKAELSRIFERQSQARWVVARSDADARIARLVKLRRAIEERRGELCAAVQADFGKHPAEMELTEIHPTLAEINHTVKHLRDWMRPRSVSTPLTLTGSTSEIRLEPRGVCLIMAPWNYPFFLLIGPLIACVAAGNTAILKPSEKVPRTSEWLAKLVREVFEESEVALVEGGAEVGDQLLELPFDHMFFTGNPHIGRKVMAAAAKHLSTVTLELGGKSPAIVDETADVAVAAERIVWGRFVNAGQTCVAPDYALVHERRVDEFVAKAKERIEHAYGPTEAARKESPDFARIVDEAAFKRLSSLLERTVQAGDVLTLGGTVDPATRYIAPTLLTGVKPTSPIMEGEIFGPILPILTFATRAEATAHVRRGTKPLALYLFAKSGEAQEEVLRDTTAGGTCVNNVMTHLGNPDLPFGGVGESGMGSYHGFAGFRTFSHERAVLRTMANTVQLFYPPYAGKAKDIFRAALKWLE